jgi:protein-S-isoprenylcysteine O-methyltransferase Ste14
MTSLKIAVAVAWIAFGAYWLVSAAGAKKGAGHRQGVQLRTVLAIAVVLLVRFVHVDGLEVHAIALAGVGAVIVASGLGFAVWARIHLGRNWGMPMTTKAEPELITSGPYRFVRHPIYTGILTAVVGTALVTNLLVLVVALILAVYFRHSAGVEERNLTASFPAAYPAYRAQTKMLVPFVF